MNKMTLSLSLLTQFIRLKPQSVATWGYVWA